MIGRLWLWFTELWIHPCQRKAALEARRKLLESETPEQRKKREQDEYAEMYAGWYP